MILRDWGLRGIARLVKSCAVNSRHPPHGAGTILLDATADIDGISSIVPWRVETKTPKATYDNLEIIHVPQHTKKRLSEYLKTALNQRTQVDWMVETIKQQCNQEKRA